VSVSKVVDSVFEYRPIGYGASVFSGFAFKSSDLKGEGIPVIKIGNIQNRVVDYSNTQFFPEEKVTSRHEKYFLSDGDVLIAMTGQGSVGRVGKIRILDSKKILLNQRVGKFAVDNINLDNNYLYYIISSPLYESILFNAGTGSGQPNLSPQDILSVEIPYPDIKEQKAIAATLSVLDDMIELNNQINKTLEEMAQAIFKSWFVDFEPFKNGEFEESELGLIPKGWRVGVLGDIIDIFDSKRVPLSNRQRSVMEKKYPYYGAATLMDYVDNYIFDGVYVLLGEDGTVMDEKGYPILQYVWGKFWVNNHAHVLKGKGVFSDEYLYILLKNTNVASIVTGAVQLKINQNNLTGLKIMIPPEDVVKQYNDVVKDIFACFRSNADEIKILISLRDTLLPKLISGEIRVPVEEVV
jgi:type I restriction enzyme S subunit